MSFFVSKNLNPSNSNFDIIQSRNSGFKVTGQSNHLIRLTDREGKTLIIASQNNDVLKVFEMNQNFE